MSEYSPAALGEALREALDNGANPFAVPSDWIHVIFPTDCGGELPEQDDDYVWDQNYYLLTSCGLDNNEIDSLMHLYGVPKPVSARTETYTDIYGKTFPTPPLADLRRWLTAVLPESDSKAAEAWWIEADHPGSGMDGEHTAAAMRQAGFTEAEIRCYLIDMLDKNEDGPFPAPGTAADQAITDALVRIVHAEAISRELVIEPEGKQP